MRSSLVAVALACVALGCGTGPDAQEGLVSSSSSKSLLAPEDPVPMMTWEGCQLTEGCAGSDSTLSMIHDGNPSDALYDPNTPDPSPTAPGIWIGLGAADCYVLRASSTTGWIDRDTDGLRDECEFRLATAFAPMVNISSGESCLEGEPYWAAKFIDNLEPVHTGDMVKLAYLPGYYRDCGIGEHDGDSEFIQLTVVYNYATQHWELVNSFLSAHSCVSLECQIGGAVTLVDGRWGPSFEWPSGRAASFPRIFLSADKHANYRSRSDCDAGGAFGEDTCTGAHDVGRFRVWEAANIGSAHHQLLDCVTSRAGHPGTECLWAGTSFRGWSIGVPGVTPYSHFLLSVIFQGTPIDYFNWWTGSYAH